MSMAEIRGQHEERKWKRIPSKRDRVSFETAMTGEAIGDMYSLPTMRLINRNK